MTGKFTAFLGLVIVWLTCIAAIPKPDEDNKVHLPHNPLEQHSKNVKHFRGEEHNPLYDHESFLGEDEAKTFQQLPSGESKRRLSLIVDRIDDDKNDFVDLSELKRWIEYAQRRYIDEDVARMWRQHNPQNSSTISWDSYRKSVYGFLEGLNSQELAEDANAFSYKHMMSRDRRRWGVADKDLDDALTRDQFSAFLHPEEHEYMRDIILTETIEDMDKNKDGKISMEEYIGDMYTPSHENEEEPDWVINERETFVQVRDSDGDGFMSRDEVIAWIAPEDYNHAELEARHLLYEADKNQDKRLTKEEILEKYDVFVGSQATNFGEDLARHDEF